MNWLSNFVRPKINSFHYGVNSMRSFGPIVWDNMILYVEEK